VVGRIGAMPERWSVEGDALMDMKSIGSHRFPFSTWTKNE
jgi:hypothetical protein